MSPLNDSIDVAPAFQPVPHLFFTRLPSHVVLTQRNDCQDTDLGLPWPGYWTLPTHCADNTRLSLSVVSGGSADNTQRENQGVQRRRHFTNHQRQWEVSRWRACAYWRHHFCAAQCQRRRRLFHQQPGAAATSNRTTVVARVVVAVLQQVVNWSSIGK